MRSIFVALAILLAPQAVAQLRSEAVPLEEVFPPEAPSYGTSAAWDDEVTPEEIDAVSRLPRPSQSGALGRDVDNVLGIAPGQILILSARHVLYLGVDASTVRAYPIAVGRRGAQWRGDAVIGRKVVNPTWRPTRNQRRLKRLPSVVRPGPSNPLGVRALYLYRNGHETLYRIHGTNAPGSIGRSVSSGCIRMRNADVIDLYRRAPVGTRVSVR